MTSTYAGRLLVAAPRLTEPVFRRSVIQILHHDADGAHGVVLNKPLGVDVDRVLPGWAALVSRPHGLFQGGPVGLDTALALAWVPTRAPEGVFPLFGDLGVLDLDAAEVTTAVEELAGVRIFAGYCGWSGGQLEQEIAEGSWFVVESRATDAFGDAPERLWRDVLARQRGRLSLVATFPADPSWN